MDKGKIQKIYSRRIPRIKYFKGNNEDNNDKQKIKKILKIIIVLTIAFMIVNSVINIIEPIIDLQSVIMAKSVATRITNEQSKKVMEKYQYEDLVNITKDSNGNITMISANVTTVNKMIADISTKIQRFEAFFGEGFMSEYLKMLEIELSIKKGEKYPIDKINNELKPVLDKFKSVKNQIEYS